MIVFARTTSPPSRCTCRVRRVDPLDPAGDEDLGAEPARLLQRAPGELVAGDAVGEAEVVLDPRRRAGLAAGRLALDDDRAQALRGAVHGGREPGGPGADDDRVVLRVLGLRAELEQLGDAAVPGPDDGLAVDDADRRAGRPRRGSGPPHSSSASGTSGVIQRNVTWLRSRKRRSAVHSASQRWPRTTARGGAGRRRGPAGRAGPTSGARRAGPTSLPTSGTSAATRVVVARLQPHHARGLGGAEADREDRAEHDRHLAEDVARVALADDARDAVACLTGSIRPSSTANSARSLPSSAAYSPATRLMSAAARETTRALGLVEAREERDPGDLVVRDHGRILNRRGPTVRIKMARLPRHFLTGAELDARELGALLDRALVLKQTPYASRALEGRAVALVFEQPSTRTRTSFEVGIVELGGHPMVLRPGELQLTRGESVRDTALVLSRHVAAIALRTGTEATLRELAEHAEVPVVNMLSPEHHPCQALADLLTMREAFGDIAGRRLAYVGDGNNVARSLAIVGGLAGVEVTVAAPAGHQLADGAGARLTDDPVAAADGRGRALHRRLGLDERRRGDRGRSGAPRSAPTGSTTPCWTVPRRARSPSTACPRTRARRSPSRCSTARASGSGTRRRTAVTPRRPCSSSSSRSLPGVVDPRDVVVITRARLQEVVDGAVARGRHHARGRGRAARRADHRAARPRAPRLGQAPDRRLRRPDRRGGRARARRAARRSTCAGSPAYERANANRKTVLAAIERKLG